MEKLRGGPCLLSLPGAAGLEPSYGMLLGEGCRAPRSISLPPHPPFGNPNSATILRNFFTIYFHDNPLCCHLPPPFSN